MSRLQPYLGIAMIRLIRHTCESASPNMTRSICAAPGSMFRSSSFSSQKLTGIQRRYTAQIQAGGEGGYRGDVAET